MAETKETAISLEEFSEAFEMAITEFLTIVNEANDALRIRIRGSLRRFLGQDLSDDPMPARSMRDG